MANNRHYTKAELQQHQNGQILRLAVDHRHSDKKIRGLLCRSCNLMIANAKESIKTLASAIQYLGVSIE